MNTSINIPPINIICPIIGIEFSSITPKVLAATPAVLNPVFKRASAFLKNKAPLPPAFCAVFTSTKSRKYCLAEALIPLNIVFSCFNLS